MDVPTLVTPAEIARVGAVVMLLLLPGAALTSRLRGLTSLGGPARAGVAVSLGLSVAFVLYAVLSLLGLGVGIAVAATVILAVASVGLLLSGIRSRPPSRGELRRRLAPETSVVLLVSAVLFVFGALSIRPITSYSDVPDHLGTVRAIAERGVLEPNDVFYVEGDGEVPDLRKGYYHTWLAVALRLSGLDGPSFWYALRPWLLMLAAVGIQPLLVACFPRPRARIASTLLLPMLVHGNAAWFLDTFAYPHNLDWVPIWTALGLGIAVVGEERGSLLARHALVAAAAIAFALPLLHVFAPILLLAGAITVPTALLVLGPRDRAGTALRTVGILLAAAALPLVWRLATTYHPVNPLHLETSEIFYLTDRLTLHAPEPMFHKFSLYVVGMAILSLLWLWRRDVRSWRRATLVGLTAGPLLVSLNPVLGGILQPYLGYLFVRFLGVVPYAAVGGALVADALARSPRSIVGRWIPLLLVLVVCTDRVPPLLNLTRDGRARADLRVSPERWSEGLELLAASVPAGETVVTDPFTGYGLPAYTGHRILAMLDQHSSPSDPRIRSRLDEVSRVLNPHVPLSEAIDLLVAHDAKVVFLNQSFTRTRASHSQVRTPRSYALERARFEGPGAPFRTLASTPTVAIYELDLTSPRSPLPEPPPPPGLVTDGRYRDHPRTTLTEAVAMLGVEGLAEVVEAGDTLVVGVVLEKTSAVPPATPFRLVVRARREGTSSVREMSALDRFRARLRQDAGGPRVEVLRNRRPLDGAYPVAHWPVGTVIVDTVRIPLPPDLEPGEYAVGVYLHEQRLVRNIALRDWLRPGGGMGTVVGRTRVVSPRQTQP